MYTCRTCRSLSVFVTYHCCLVVRQAQLQQGLPLAVDRERRRYDEGLG